MFITTELSDLFSRTTAAKFFIQLFYPRQVGKTIALCRLLMQVPTAVMVVHNSTMMRYVQDMFVYPSRIYTIHQVLQQSALRGTNYNIVLADELRDDDLVSLRSEYPWLSIFAVGTC